MLGKIPMAADKMNQRTRLACTTYQDLLLVLDSQSIVDAPDRVVLPRDVEMPSGEFEVKADDANPNFSTCSRTAFRGESVC